MKFSKQTGCFYPDDIQYPELPSDLIKVTEAEFASALNREKYEALDVMEGRLVITSEPPVTKEQTSEKLKQQASFQIDRLYAEFIQKQVGHPTQAEKDTWSFKLDLAHAITRGASLNTFEVSFLERAGLTTKDLKASWAQSVLGNAAAYAQIIGLAENMRKTCRRIIADTADASLFEEAIQTQSNIAEKAAADLFEQRSQAQQEPLLTQNESEGFFYRLLFRNK